MAAQVDAIRTQLAFYASTPSYKPILDLHGWGDVATELTRMSKNGQWDEMPRLVDDDMVDAFAIVSPSDQVRDRVQARCAGAIDRVSFIATVPDAVLLELNRAQA
jgi:hypothetical protein